MADFSDITKTAVEAAQMSGAILAKGFNTHFEVHSKEGKHNLVTEYDLKSEKSIIEFIKSRHPNDAFLAEEGGGEAPKKDQVQWVIDPLDGTVNFAHSIPMFAVSIAARLNQQTITGVVYHPLLNELFVAEKGKGAYLNGNQTHVTKVKDYDYSIIATGFPYYLAEKSEECISPLVRVLKTGVPIRRIGVASIDLAYVACGRFDGFFEHSLGPWDCAAGNLLVEESGGKVSTWNNQPFDIESYSPIVASNGLIHNALSEKLA